MRTRSQSTRNYELDKRVSHITAAPGRVRRVSVAVVLDDRITVRPEGSVERVSWPQEDIDRITALVREAVGFDAQRGDTVNVMNATFATTPFDPNLLPFWRQDWFLGLCIVALALALNQWTDVFGSLERRFYDTASTASSRKPSERIAVIAIDDHSIANIGRWPWARDVHGKLIDQLSQAGAKTIAHRASSMVAGNSAGLRSEGRLDAMASRETVFLFNNLFLTMAICFAVMLVMVPLLKRPAVANAAAAKEAH